MGRNHSASGPELLVFLKTFKDSFAQQERSQATAIVLQCASRVYLARKSLFRTVFIRRVMGHVVVTNADSSPPATGRLVHS